MSAPEPPSALSRIPRGIWVLGGVSMLMDMSSEMVHSLLPVFVVGTLGASAFTLGLVDGAAEAVALFVRAFSGALSDAFGKRKPLAVAGCALGALAKPLFALATAASGVLAARLVDRIGKGIRGAPYFPTRWATAACSPSAGALLCVLTLLALALQRRHRLG